MGTKKEKINVTLSEELKRFSVTYADGTKGTFESYTLLDAQIAAHKEAEQKKTLVTFVKPINL
jgi:hypothetical protein